MEENSKIKKILFLDEMGHTNEVCPKRWFHGKGHSKFTNDEVDYVLSMFELGYGCKRVMKSFNEVFGSNVNHQMVLRIRDEPHKYRPGYIKPRPMN